MEIRKSLRSEIEDIGAFYDAVVAYLDEHINYPKWIYKVYPSSDFAREMTEEGSQYVCLDDGKIVAAFVLNLDPQGSYQKAVWKRDLPDGSYLVMHAVAVDQDLSRRGIGSEIIRFCRKKAEEEGYEALRVDVVPENTPARSLYEKNGFEYAGDWDLERGIEGIPYFSLYEMNL